MNNDDFQVLGSGAGSVKSKKRKRILAGLGFLALLAIIGLWCWGNASSKDKKVGELTIQPKLQTVVDSLLNKELLDIDGLQGQVIVMEVQTGKILAMAGRERRFDGMFQPCKNFAFQQEPGSIMLTASLLALLETGEVKLDDMVDTYGGVWCVDDTVSIRDHNWQRGGYGSLLVEEALRFSSNIGISRMMDKIFHGKEMRYYELIDKMSLGKPDSVTGIDGLKPMVCSSPKDSLWTKYRLYWNSIGYELSMAPIQTLTFYNAIANGGKMVKPMLYADSVEVINPQIAKKESIAQIQFALERTVSQGLGRKAGTQKMRVAGTVGDAQVKIQYDDHGEGIPVEYHVSFCGYFPADKPRYSMIVSLNKQGLPASGGGMAGVLFHNVAEWIAAHPELLKE